VSHANDPRSGTALAEPCGGFGPGVPLEFGWTGGDRPETGSPRGGRRARRLLIAATLACAISASLSLSGTPVSGEPQNAPPQTLTGEVGLGIVVMERYGP